MARIKECCENTFGFICGCICFVIIVLVLGLIGMAVFLYVIYPMVKEDQVQNPKTIIESIQRPTKVLTFAESHKPIIVDGKVVAYLDKTQGYEFRVGKQGFTQYMIGEEGVVEYNDKVIAYVELGRDITLNDLEKSYVINGCKWKSGPEPIYEKGSIVEFGANIEGGTTIKSGAIIATKAIIETGVIVHENVTIGVGAHLKSGAIINANAEIQTNVTIGIGATIGDYSIIGSNAVVADWAVVEPDTQLEGDAYIH